MIILYIEIFDFNHDINGNPVAHHCLKSFNENGKLNIERTKRRKQIGYSDHLDYAEQLINKYTPKGFAEVSRVKTGTRSEGGITVEIKLDKV